MRSLRFTFSDQLPPRGALILTRCRLLLRSFSCLMPTARLNLYTLTLGVMTSSFRGSPRSFSLCASVFWPLFGENAQDSMWLLTMAKE
eukprot:1719558-Amphidinium_carterae.1